MRSHPVSSSLVVRSPSFACITSLLRRRRRLHYFSWSQLILSRCLSSCLFPCLEGREIRVKAKLQRQTCVCLILPLHSSHSLPPPAAASPPSPSFTSPLLPPLLPPFLALHSHFCPSLFELVWVQEILSLTQYMTGSPPSSSSSSQASNVTKETKTKNITHDVKQRDSSHSLFRRGENRWWGI